MQKVYFHVDLDAFFASVEQLDHPEYRYKPVIVGGLPGDKRSVVSTASYEARKFGVHSAMPVQTAVKLCPNGIFIRGNMKRYHEKSEEVMAIFSNYSPDVQQMSIDEAFIDMTGTEKLFGMPMEAALKLKKEVKDKTGLTVSIGIASTKYLAKIASGLQKPDGLYNIEEGTEESFMLSLPLNKVWGVGSKTLARLNSLQINTTKDIHQRSLSMLQSLMGNATGDFLYHAVRGHDVKDFDAEPKNHSISSENTYSTDLIFQDQIETALLELCHTVFFRMLKEKIRSRTITLKIRYEDFTTVTCQETFSTYISSLDDYFEKTKALFRKKYELNRGIRLLGAGLHNTENESDPMQKELFDFGESRKQKVENAILKAEQKNPELKITKARLIKKITTLILAAFLLNSTQKVSAESVKETTRQSDGAGAIVFDQNNVSPYFDRNSVSLFNFNIDDQDVEFLASGYWQSTFSYGAALSTGYGTTTSVTTTSPVFTQNVDLSLWLLLNRHWYFEAAFADEFEKNTIALGYTGNGFVKEARLSNRGIIFPSIYSVDEINRGIGGGDNSAPGFHLKLGSDSLYSDTVIRYDMLSSEEKRWYGKNSVNTDQYDLTQWYAGFKYAFPDNSVQYITDIYVEATNGSKTINGRKFNLLDNSQYLISASTNTLYLSKDAKTWQKNGKIPQVIAVTSKIIETGSWTDDSSFLGQIQDVFGSELNLEEYSYDFKTTVDGKNALIIQSSEGFSPFVYANIYDVGITKASDGQIASKTTEIADTRYTVLIDNEESTFVTQDFLNTHHVFAMVYNSTSASSNEYAAENRYPMAQTNPGVYLGSGTNDDSILRIRSYTRVNRFDIGSKAVPGTVHVYKNGILDNGAVYDQESGTITLSKAVGDNDSVYATWFEENENSDNGSIVLASGLGFDITGNLTGDVSMSSRINYSPDKHYSTADSSSPSFATLASRLTWNDSNLKLTNISAVSLDQHDNTGICRILSMEEDRNETLYLSPSSGYNLPSEIIPVLTERDGTISSISLVEENDGTLSVSKGKQDSGISGYAVPVEFNFTHSATESQPNWAAVSIAIPGVSTTLKNARTFSFALKNASSGSFDVYLQLGVNADTDLYSENKKIPCWKISQPGQDVLNYFDTSKTTWQTVTVSLTDTDKSHISSDTDARIIIISKDEVSGTLYAGPYEAEGLNFNIQENKDFSIYSSQETDPSLKNSTVSRINSGKNYVQKFTWKANSTLTEEENLNFNRYFEETDISLYKELNLWIKTSTDTDSISITLDRKNKSGINEKAVNVVIPGDIISSLDDQKYHKLTVNLNTGKADISGINIPSAYVNTKIVPVRLSIDVSTKNDGSLYIDELILQESSSTITLTDKITGEYNVKNNVFKSLNLKTSTLYNCAFDINNTNKNSQSVQSDAEADILTGNLHINLTTTASNTDNKVIPQASHTIETSSPVFKILSLGESYNYNYSSSSLNKQNSLTVNLSPFNIPLTWNNQVSSTSDSWAATQNAQSTLSFTGTIISSSTKFSASQKLTDTTTEKNKYNAENYFSSWYDISSLEFSTGKENASSRTVQVSESLTFKLPFASCKPQLSFTTKEDYKKTSSAKYSDNSTASLQIPFTAGKNSFLFKYSKSAGLTKNTICGGTYSQDVDSLKDSLGDMDWFIKSVPFYDLFASSIKKSCEDSVNTQQIESGFYTGTYSLSWRRNFSATKWDFFIPSSSGLNVSRDIRCATSQTDIKQFQTWATFSSMNIFGKTGTVKLFDFFQQDEYTTSLEASVKLPESNSNAQIKIAGYTMASIYINETDLFTAAFDCSYTDTDENSFKSTLTWKRKAQTTPVVAVVRYVNKDAVSTVSDITRKDSLNFNLESTEEQSSRKISWIHNLDVQLSKYKTLNTEISLSWNEITGKIIYLNAAGSVGLLIKF